MKGRTDIPKKCVGRASGHFGISWWMDDRSLIVQLLIWVTEKEMDDDEGGAAASIVSTVCPTTNAMPKQLPSLVHDERGNTLYEEPSVAWMHVRVNQVTIPPLSPLRSCH